MLIKVEFLLLDFVEKNLMHVHVHLYMMYVFLHRAYIDHYYTSKQIQLYLYSWF